jgi:hypothetical protein
MLAVSARAEAQTNVCGACTARKERCRWSAFAETSGLAIKKRAPKPY